MIENQVEGEADYPPEASCYKFDQPPEPDQRKLNDGTRKPEYDSYQLDDQKQNNAEERPAGSDKQQEDNTPDPRAFKGIFYAVFSAFQEMTNQVALAVKDLFAFA